MIRIYTGKPNRPSRTYDELVARYTHKLEQGDVPAEDLLLNPFQKMKEQKK
ncbi:MAG: hypothetical protein IPI68_04935 [Chitinophagaceae bacterium]|nr:hypothetical protein [Chitinophagaceae bacterium]